MNNTPLVLAMCRYEQDCMERVNHFLKVYACARTIGEGEGLDELTQQILETAAIVHDIGIRPSMEKYGSGAGKYQELEGPPVARELLGTLGYANQVIDRVCTLVGHHHTYQPILGLDHQILVEADFLVNMDEGHMDTESIRRVTETIFSTETGKKLLFSLYLQEK